MHHFFNKRDCTNVDLPLSIIKQTKPISYFQYTSRSFTFWRTWLSEFWKADKYSRRKTTYTETHEGQESLHQEAKT